MIKHKKGAIRMIKYIFPEPVFLDLCDDQGKLVGKTPKEIIKHLQDTFCDDEESEEEILKQYKIMNVRYDPSDLVQVYFKALQDARTILASLNETVNDKVLIRQGIDQFNKHMDLNESVDEWKKKPALNKTWTEFKTHFSKAIAKNQKRSGTLKEIGIANQVQEQVAANHENTEIVAQTIDALTARLAHLEATKNQAYGAQVPPTVITPPTADDMSQITTMLHTVMAAQTKMEVTTLRRRKANDSGQQKTTTYPMGNAPNVVTPPATPIVTPADMTFQPNMTARPADEKKTATRIAQQPSQARWAAPNATASTTKAPDGVGGLITSVVI
eukprot:scaffold22535_cov32-Attheya_sp.AAC.2